jgi:hypothetical protein
MPIDFRKWLPELVAIELAFRSNSLLSGERVPVIDPLKAIEDEAFSTIQQLEMAGSLSLKEAAKPKRQKSKTSRRRALRASHGRVNRMP